MKQRYIRQISLPEIGSKGQEKLSKASVLVVGAGGLGCPALLYLAAAGVGTIGIVDGDLVEISNLHRQVLYGEGDIGKQKTEAAADRLREMNSEIDLHTHPAWLNRENAKEILGDYDIIIDGTDNFPTRYLINDACVLLGKPFIYGSIYRFEGQISLFNHLKSEKTRRPNYRDLFPEPPPAELVPDCSEAGVMGVLPGIIGTLQATEAIKWITGMDGLLDGKLLIFDAVNYESRTINIYPRNDNPISGQNPTITDLIDYEQFCSPQTDTGISNISPAELVKWMKSDTKPELLDVRTAEEHKAFNIGGKLIPHSEIESISEELKPNTKTVLYCRTGKRSSKAIRQLKDQGATGELYNLTGGIEAWKRIINS